MDAASPLATPTLRLLVVTHFFPSHGGGIERVAGSLAREFSARAVRIQWISSDTDAPPPPLPGMTATAVPSTNCVERWTQVPYPIWTPSGIAALWRAVGNCEIVHVHEHLYFGSVLAVLIARIRRRPVVLTQHMGALGLPTRMLTAVYSVAARILGALMFPLVARSVFISANVRAFFHRDNAAKSRLIFNGIEPALFQISSDETRRELRASMGIAPKARVILFVGRFVRKKGLRILERLTAEFPDLLWIFAGSGPETPAAWNRTNVMLLGKVDHDRLPAIYQVADLLILPSSGEGLPLVVQEALMCGLGVLSTEEVATACPAAQGLIRAHETPRGDHDSGGWAYALRKTLADHAYLEARQQRARVARELWSWDTCSTQYLQIFSEILANPTPTDATRGRERNSRSGS